MSEPTEKPICGWCGFELPVVRVKVPVYIEFPRIEGGTVRQVPRGYEWEDEIGDCRNCRGAS